MGAYDWSVRSLVRSELAWVVGMPTLGYLLCLGINVFPYNSARHLLAPLLFWRYFIVKIWKSVLEQYKERFWKYFIVVIIKHYKNNFNFEYGTPQIHFSHFKCPRVTYLKFEFFLSCFIIFIFLSLHMLSWWFLSCSIMLNNFFKL